jgi:hypothetical protein
MESAHCSGVPGLALGASARLEQAVLGAACGGDTYLALAGTEIGGRPSGRLVVQLNEIPLILG